MGVTDRIARVLVSTADLARVLPSVLCSMKFALIEAQKATIVADAPVPFWGLALNEEGLKDPILVGMDWG